MKFTMADYPTLAQAFHLDENTSCIVKRNVRDLPFQGGDFVVNRLVLCINHTGTARVLYDQHETTLVPNVFFFVLPNHILRRVETSPDYNSTLVILSEKFLQQLKQRILSHDYQKFHLDPETQLSLDQTIGLMKMIDLLEEASLKSKEEMPHREEVILSLLVASYEFLNACRRVQDSHLPQSQRNTDLFNQFCNLLAQHYRESREVSFYASKLHLTPKYFSKIIYEAIGVTAGRWIDDFVSTKAKQILATRPGLTVQEVSFMLGFTEEAGFCRFFKRVTGLTPKEFRKSAIAH